MSLVPDPSDFPHGYVPPIGNCPHCGRDDQLFAGNPCKLRYYTALHDAGADAVLVASWWLQLSEYEQRLFKESHETQPRKPGSTPGAHALAQVEAERDTERHGTPQALPGPAPRPPATPMTNKDAIRALEQRRDRAYEEARALDFQVDTLVNADLARLLPGTQWEWEGGMSMHLARGESCEFETSLQERTGWHGHVSLVLGGEPVEVSCNDGDIEMDLAWTGEKIDTVKEGEWLREVARSFQRAAKSCGFTIYTRSMQARIQEAEKALAALRERDREIRDVINAVIEEMSS